MSPTLHALSVGFKQEAGQPFCETVSILLISSTLHNLQKPSRILIWAVHTAVEEMPFATETARPGSELLLGCQQEGSLVVLKHFARDLEPDAIGSGFLCSIPEWMSPTLHALAIGFKQEAGQPFCEMISILFLSSAFHNL